MKRLAIAMIVKNEESCLAKCLDSFKMWQGVYPIYIADTGSTDKTKEIAAKYTDKIFDYKWNDNFAEARNFIQEKVESDWTLSIDADEYMNSGDLFRIMNAINEADAHGLHTVSVKIDYGTLHHYFPKIYRSAHRWKGAIHNYLDVVEDNKSDIIIFAGRSKAHANDPDRAFRILTKEVNSGKGPREIYYLAREYWYKKQYEMCIDKVNQYLKRANWQPEIADAYLMRARCHGYLKQYAQARDSCMKAININADFKEALDFMGRLTGPNNSARWHEAAFRATNKNVLFIRDIRNERDKQLERCIPGLFDYKSVLYIGANIYRCDVLKDFRNHGYKIDILEPFKGNCDYYRGVIGINKVHQGTIQKFITPIKYDIVFWWHGPEHVTKEDLEISLKNMESMAKFLVVLGSPWGKNDQEQIYGNPLEKHVSSIYEEDFNQRGYAVDAIGTKDTWNSNLLIWRDFRREIPRYPEHKGKVDTIPTVDDVIREGFHNPNFKHGALSEPRR